MSATYAYAIFNLPDIIGSRTFDAAISTIQKRYPSGTQEWAESQFTLRPLFHEEWINVRTDGVREADFIQGQRQWKQTVRRLLVTGHEDAIRELVGGAAGVECVGYGRL